MKTRILSWAIVIVLACAVSGGAADRDKGKVTTKKPVAKQQQVTIRKEIEMPKPAPVTPAAVKSDTAREPVRFQLFNPGFSVSPSSASFVLTKHAWPSATLESSSASFEVRGTYGEPVVGGLSSDSFDCALGFWPDYGNPGCCEGATMGNVDCEGIIDIGDVTVMIQNLLTL